MLTSLWHSTIERMVGRMPQKSIEELISGATENLYMEKYSDRRIKSITYTWKCFHAYCKEKGYTTFLPEYKSEYIKALAERNPSFKEATLKIKSAHLQMLNLFDERGAWKKSTLHPLPELSDEFKRFLEEQDKYLVKTMHSEYSCKTIREQVYRILLYFQKKGITKLSEITNAEISSYILTLKGHAKSTINGEISRLRVFLRTAYLLEYTKEDLSQCVPQYKLGQAQSFVKIWSSEEINKVLDSVDQSSPTGKRDAAVITIAAELGVRSRDICNLQLSDIDWDNCCISFIQSKTTKANILPLSQKVGDAIINYLKVRPETDSEYLFVSAVYPHGKMKSFGTKFERYVRRSGVTIPPKAHHGLHSLRATVATKLLDADVSPDVIYPFLGHSDRETLNHYLRLDIEKLRSCALSFEDGELV